MNPTKIWIRNASEPEMQYFVEMAAKEGWNPGLDDASTFYKTDPTGFFIALSDSMPVGCISAVKYGTFGFIGFYIVNSEYRGKGIGINLWSRALQHLNGCNIGLDGVPQQETNYKKSGFIAEHRNYRMKGSSETILSLTKNKSHILLASRLQTYIDAKTINFDDLTVYDRNHFPGNRATFLKEWISSPHSHSIVHTEGKMIKGFGKIRKCIDGWKIGPLYAENPLIAEILFIKLISKIDKSDIYIDISSENIDAQLLCKRYSLTQTFETIRMYTAKKPDIQWDDIYGITTFELG